MYINMKTFQGILKMLAFCNDVLKILMVSDKQIHKAFRIHKTINKPQ